ncbi:response regulator transcription factor [Clostridium sartagoforme]|uniref:Stage 0 sporulation protein A homolog n=1 Tax=Clostridium sartagoforme TaxID=84031 RepID=A0A4S2DKK9_9CLOT|nr:response regulator transcription factor [Clostridium sartagoforme]TGY41504.1 response regulator transcription factor [Clostridium sartagoforme]
MNNEILIVEDDKSINDILFHTLKSEGYAPYSAFSLKDARNYININLPDLILLDLNLPDGDGFQLCKEINLNNSIPIIILTAKSDIVDKVLGLELGADDYITKPFHIKEVISRIRAIFRRIEKTTNGSNSNFTNINDSIKINFKNRTVLKNNDLIQLKPKEYELLEFFVQNRNKVFSREQLIDNVWEFSYDGDLRTVDIHIRRLRSKLDTKGTPSIIETVFSVGYIMR